MLKFLNFPAIKFNKSDISHENLKKIFTDDELNGQLWKRAMIDAILKDDFIDKQLLTNTYKIKYNYARYLIDLLISEFTLEPQDEEMIEYYKNKAFEFSDGFVNDIKMIDKVLFISTKKGDFEVKKLSDVYPELASEINVKSKERYGDCHEISIKISKKLNIPNRVATGYIAPFSKRSKSLHSWVDLGRDIIDGTINAVISKKAYYMIRDISGPIYKISPERLTKDENILSTLIEEDPLLSKLYLANRHQAIQVYKLIKLKEEQEKTKLKTKKQEENDESNQKSF